MKSKLFHHIAITNYYYFNIAVNYYKIFWSWNTEKKQTMKTKKLLPCPHQNNPITLDSKVSTTM